MVLNDNASLAGKVSEEAVFTDTPHGAFYQPVHLVRRVKIYPIQETELTSLAIFSTIVTGAGAIAGIVVGFFLSIIWDVVIASDPKVQGVGAFVSGLCVFVLLGCAIIGGWAFKKRGSTLRKILSEVVQKT